MSLAQGRPLGNATPLDSMPGPRLPQTRVLFNAKPSDKPLLKVLEVSQAGLTQPSPAQFATAEKKKSQYKKSLQQNG